VGDGANQPVDWAHDAAVHQVHGLLPGHRAARLRPVKLVAAVLLTAGLAFRPASIAGAALTIAICALYLIRLAAPSRRDPSGVAAFLLFGALAVALLVLQILR
jgi:hypothetical protein